MRWRDLFEKSNSASVARNTFYQLVGKFLGIASTFPITLLVAQRFGASGYGDFTKVMSYLALFFLVGDFGLNAIYLQQAQRREEATSLWFNLLVLRVGLGIILAVIALAILILLPQGYNQGYTALVRLGIIIFVPAIIFQNLITTANAVFQKNLRYDLSSWALGIGGGLALFFLWPIARAPESGKGVLWAVGAILVGTLITAVVSLILAKKLFKGSGFILDWPQIIRLLRPTIPLGITMTLHFFYFRSDSFILTLTRPTTDVGIYGLAYKVFEVVLVLPTFFMNAVYPFMVQQNFASGLKISESKNLTPGLVRIIKKSFGILASLSLLAVIGLWVAAPLLTIIKADFVYSIPVLRVLALGLPFFFITPITLWTIITLQRQNWLIFVYGTSMVINILLNIYFIPRYGYMAAAWTTGICEGLVLVFSLLVLWKILRNWHQSAAVLTKGDQ